MNVFASPSPPSRPLPAETDIRVIRGAKRWLLFPFSWGLRLWAASLHFELSPASRAVLSRDQVPVVFMLWHNRLFLSPEVARRYRSGRALSALVSASRDGAWLSALFDLLGLRTVRGSSSKRGREAVTALVQAARAGHDIGITPDGPRGPRYAFKAGGLLVARRVKAPIILLGGRFESSWQLKSWDRFYLPKPFSRVHITADWIPPSALDQPEATAAALQRRLLAMNADASTPSEQPSPPIV